MEYLKKILFNNKKIKFNIFSFIKQLNRDPLNVTFHASAAHITIIRSITKNSNQRMSNIYPHGKQSKVMGGMKFETVHDVLT